MRKTSLFVVGLLVVLGAAALLIPWRKETQRAISTDTDSAQSAPPETSHLPVIAPDHNPDTRDAEPSNQPLQGQGRVSVRAILRDGSVASGARLSLHFHEGAGDTSAPSAYTYSGTTDHHGEFSFQGLPWGDYRLTGQTEGLSSYANLKLSERRPLEVVDLILKPSGAIEVEVQNIHRSPIEGARVRALNANFHNEIAATATSDAAGIVQLSDLPVSLYVLQVESEGYATLRTPPVAVGEPRFAVTLTKEGAIAGQIRTVSGGYPSSNVRLKLEPEHWEDVQYEVASDPRGVFLLENLPEGSVKIYGSDDAFALVPTVAFTTVSENQVSRVELIVAEGAKISGVVSDKESGEPIGGAIVSVFDPEEPHLAWNSEPTANTGRYEVTKFPPGRLSVRVSLVPPPYSIFSLPAPTELELAPGEARVDVNIAIDPGYTLCGVVLDDQGLPCPQAVVAMGRVRQNEAEPYHYESVNCDREGRFCFSDVDFATTDIQGGNALVLEITLTANGRGLRSDSLRIPLDTNASTDDIVLELKARPSGTVGGTVVDEQGRPALARLWLRPPGKTPGFDVRSAINDLDGQFLFLDIAPGDYELWVAPEPDARKARRILGKEFSLQSDERLTDLHLVLPTGGEISGRVTTEHGEPLRGIQVDAIAASDLTGDEISSATTDNEGYFTIRNLAKDETYELLQSRSEPGSRWSVEARLGDDLEIVLPQSVVDDKQPADEELWLYERETGRTLKLPGSSDPRQ